MKNKYITLALICITITFFACKKDNKNPVVGQWQQNKLRIYSVGATGTIINDTTYTGNTFTSLDYAQFNSNGTCVISGSHYYYPADEGFPKNPQVATSKITLNYTPIRSQYLLTNTSINPGGFVTTDTTTIVSSHNLLIHVSDYGHSIGDPATIFDSYYTR